MSRKFVFVTAVAVCLALAIVPAFADRSVDRSTDRSDRASSERGTQSAATDLQATSAPLQRARTLDGDAATLAAAQAALANAAKQDNAGAITSLQQVLNLDLPQSEAGDAIRAAAYTRLGQLAQSSQKQVAYFGVALQYATDSETRSQLESAIASLGGNVFDLAVQPNGAATQTTRDPGPDDSCGGAVPYPGMPITMSITPSGDANWVSVTVPGPDGEVVRVETISDQPGTTADDTTLELWNDCIGGVEDNILDSNDDWSSGSCVANDPGYTNSAIFMSCLQSPLLPGTYYVRVGGFFDLSTPDNFDLVITTLETFELPEPDAYENDDDKATAADIGYATSIPTQANGWGRAHKEIQDHTIFPGGDVDHQRVRLNRSELVRLDTAAQFPTFFNGFEASAGSDDPSTDHDVLYGTEPNYGGRCNQPNAGFPNVCFSDADCDGLIGPDAIPGFPDCMPIQLFNGGLISSTVPNPLTGYPGNLWPGFETGPDIQVCLPRETVADASNNTREWVSRVSALSAADFFEYQVLARNQIQCRYEDELGGNDWLFGAVADPNAAEDLTIGETVHGIYDFAAANPFADSDVFKFDVDEETFAVFQTDGVNSRESDTYLEIFVGPDDSGSFYLTGVSDEDGGDQWLSIIEVNLPPADALLGNQVADANYYIQVTSRYFNPNFPWTLITEAPEPPLFGTEGDGTCDGEGALNPIAPGDTYASEINPACDYDAYKLSLGDDTFVSIAAEGGDAAIQVEDCNSGDVIACDDDSGPGLFPLLEGCLPAGDYCIRVRAFSSSAVFPYSLTVGGGQTGCNPSGLSGDGAFTCTDFDGCGN